jgi:hypothetical protein
MKEVHQTPSLGRGRGLFSKFYSAEKAELQDATPFFPALAFLICSFHTEMCRQI